MCAQESIRGIKLFFFFYKKHPIPELKSIPTLESDTFDFQPYSGEFLCEKAMRPNRPTN